MHRIRIDFRKDLNHTISPGNTIIQPAEQDGSPIGCSRPGICGSLLPIMHANRSYHGLEANNVLGVAALSASPQEVPLPIFTLIASIPFLLRA